MKARVARRCALLVAALLLAACDRGASDGVDTAVGARADAGTACPPADVARSGGPAQLVQVGSFADSSHAGALSRELSGEGFVTAIERAVIRGRPMWRVAIVPARGGDAARLTAHAIQASGRNAVVIRSDSAPPSPAITSRQVNRGTQGMSATLRWAFSPDGCALIVQENPTAVEAEMIPDGFVYANDSSGVLFRRDSVWDVAPDPEWRRLAYGLGWRQMAGERDSLNAREWNTLAARAGLPVDTVRRGAFSATAMAIGSAVARPAVADLGGLAAGGTPAERRLSMLGGWRVGWTPDGDRLAVGLNPWGNQDFSPPTGWLLVDPATGEVMSRVDSGATFPTAEWQDGPTLDISVEVDSAAPLAAPAGAANLPVRSRAGWIEARAAGGSNEAEWIRVLPGVAFATTRAGRSIAALVPWPEAREYEPKWRVVVIRIE